MARVAWFGEDYGELPISSRGVAALLEVEEALRVIRPWPLGHRFRFEPPVSVELNSILAADDEAEAWFVRVQDGDCKESDWLAFVAWLETDTSHRDAYALVEDRHIALEAAAPPVSTPPSNLLSLPARGKPRMSRAAFAWSGAAIAAAVALVVLPATLTPSQSYATAVGQSRTVTLADGTKIVLNSGTRITLRLTPGERRVTLDEGEAAFDVTHNAKRPFRIAAGDDRVEVLGTEFDLLRHDGALKVTVRRGVVAVTPAESASGKAILVPAGKELSRRAGITTATIADVDPSQAFAWRSGHLVYRDVRLAEVAADVSRYVAKPIRADGLAADMRVTAVINLGDEAAMIGRLQAFLPVRAEMQADAVLLKLDERAR